jgi:hypothetical protein
MSKILIEEATVKQAIAAIKKCHYYMIDADLPKQSMLVEAYKAYAALEAALAEQPAPVQEPVALLPKVDVCMRAEAHGIDPSTPGLYGFYVDCISSSPQPAQQEPQTTSQERTEFEQFWVNELGESDELTYGNHRYAIHRVNAAWEAWKAGKISANQQTIMGRKVWIDWKTQALELRELVRLGGIKIAEIEAALAEQPVQQQEPVAWLHPANATCVTTDPSAYARGIPLYTSPPAQRKPLTDEQIWREYQARWPFHPAEEPRLAADLVTFARAIEAAHNIKENT